MAVVHLRCVFVFCLPGAVLANTTKGSYGQAGAGDETHISAGVRGGC